MTTLDELKLLCQVRGAKELYAEQTSGKIPPTLDPDMLQQVALDAREMLARLAEPPKMREMAGRTEGKPMNLVQVWNPKSKTWAVIDRANGKILGYTEQRWDSIPVSGPEPQEDGDARHS